MKITNPFGVAHPVSGTHQGSDFTTSTCEARYPYERGVVIWVGWEPKGLGNYIVIRRVDLENRMHFVQAGHFEKIYLKVGDAVWKGSKIGKIGHSGFAQGDHCHWEEHEPVDAGARLTAYYHEISGQRG